MGSLGDEVGRVEGITFPLTCDLNFKFNFIAVFLCTEGLVETSAKEDYLPTGGR